MERRAVAGIRAHTNRGNEEYSQTVAFVAPEAEAVAGASNHRICAASEAIEKCFFLPQKDYCLLCSNSQRADAAENKPLIFTSLSRSRQRPVRVYCADERADHNVHSTKLIELGPCNNFKHGTSRRSLSSEEMIITGFFRGAPQHGVRMPR